MATQPQFAVTPRIDYCSISAADSSYVGTGAVSVFAGGTKGSYAKSIQVKALQTTASGLIRIYTNQSGVYHLYAEIAVTAITASNTVSSFSSNLPLNLAIPSGCNLGVSTTIAQNFQITVDGGDF